MARTKAFFEQHGLRYNPHPDVVPNTMQALRLTEHARASGLHGPFHDRLMDAYWAEAKNIGDADVLLTLAAEVGLDGAGDVLAGDTYRDDIRRSTEQAHSIGISAIPAFLLDRRLIVLGAHPRETFERAFAQLDETSSSES
jgi:predicted DsbA family dithiol-disulfide isomerase